MLARVIEIVWEFVAHRGSQEEFVRVYGEQGAWARLFASSPHYLGTTLARDLTNDRRFLVIDRWRAATDFEAWRAEQQAAYSALDRACEALCERETRLGVFQRERP